MTHFKILGPYHIVRMGKARHVKFCTHIDHDEH